MSCTNLSRARQPQANGTSATAHRAAVRAGRVTGVTPTTGSLARIDRVSQYVAIMPNPPKKIAGYGFDGVDLGDPGARAGPQRVHDERDGEQEDRVEGEPARLSGGERDERGPAAGGSRPGGRERRGHDATSLAVSGSGVPPRSSR